jgi:phytoene desaturase
MPKAIVIGSGFSGLSAAATLAKFGWQVTVLEKNDQAGGRARIWKKDGYTFDMGPSWYWMPDVFESFYNQFGKTTADFYQLVRLNPSYKVVYEDQTEMFLPAEIEKLEALFESKEAGSGLKLRAFLKDAKYKYETAMSEYVTRICDKPTEFFDLKLIMKSFQMELFSSLKQTVRKKFSHPHLVKLLEFPVLFLGATPANTPALYSMMNYADLSLGTWYPMGGMNEIVKAFVSICESQGVKINLCEAVEKIEVHNKKAKQVITAKNSYEADLVIAGSDYEHTEQNLLDKVYRHYDEHYWDKRTMSPSSLLIYLGVNKRIPNLLHHNLFFDSNFDLHAAEIYDEPKWPTDPLFYVCCPSKTDNSVAPEGCENIFVLMPLAAGLQDSEPMRKKYRDLLIKKIEAHTGTNIEQNIIVERSYAMNDFKSDYNSFKGNAYGLANTLAQTAIWKPKMKSPLVKNLFYTGQLTVPGPGVPPAIISGQIAAREANKLLINQKH